MKMIHATLAVLNWVSVLLGSQGVSVRDAKHRDVRKKGYSRYSSGIHTYIYTYLHKICCSILAAVVAGEGFTSNGATQLAETSQM